MSSETDIRSLAHELVDRMTLDRLQALLDLLNEEFFSPQEIEEIKTLRASHEWYDWRQVRSDRPESSARR